MLWKQRQWPNFASGLSAQSAPFAPSPAFCCVEIRLQLLLHLFKEETGPICIISLLNGIHSGFFFFLFFQLVCSKCFLHFRDNAVVHERRRLLLRYPPFNNAPFFSMFILWLSRQLLRSWASWLATTHTAQGLQFDTPCFNYFLPHSSL